MRRAGREPSFPPASKPLVKRGVFPLKKARMLVWAFLVPCAGRGHGIGCRCGRGIAGFPVWDWQSGRKEALYEADRGMEYGFFGGCGTDAAADPDAGGRVSRFAGGLPPCSRPIRPFMPSMSTTSAASPGTIACPRCSRAGVSLAGGAMTSGSARIQAPVPRCWPA